MVHPQESTPNKAGSDEDSMFAAFEKQNTSEEGTDTDGEGSIHHDFLDSVLGVEQELFASGYESGLQAGALAHIDDGKRIGFQNGFELAKEIGYYYGCALLWARLMKTGQLPEKKGRQKHTLNQLLSLIETKVDLNPLNPLLQEQVDHIRSKFMVLTK
eukprot:CAMPEP_0177631920 /NCGR_PEP_ID=MMETSP0447-20121125/2008_1 /TAXON_ID=0 /ORGANISM="Stygamoeba regulata, Strain BSH-02190019" /LENGTH=157 /DNA_ID=CAMNT_0019133439 /DNA_START=101 /DNA_END=571 /DNA_ORIENTATION=+